MAISIFLVAAAAAAQPSSSAGDAARARAAGYAQAQAALSGAPVQYASPSQAATRAPVATGGLVPGSSRAFDGLQFQPIPSAGANVRYYKGVPTIDREDEAAAVQVMPIGLDHNRLTFAVSVLNLSQAPDDFGIEDVTAAVGDQSLPVLSRNTLDHRAANRAHWKQFAVAMAGGLSAAAAASTRDTYHATTYTPYGTYRTTITTPSISGQIAAANASADASYAIASIQARLDATRDALADEILQTTTIMPQDSYAARVVVEKFKGKWPQRVHLVMAFAGREYPFDFEVSKER